MVLPLPAIAFVGSTIIPRAVRNDLRSSAFSVADLRANNQGVLEWFAIFSKRAFFRLLF